jgi:hypothetical protein
MPPMRPPRLPCQKETLRRLRIRRDQKTQTLLVAEQENNPRKNSLNLCLPEFNLTTRRLLRNGRSTMPTLQSTNAVERQTENIHLSNRRIHPWTQRPLRKTCRVRDSSESGSHFRALRYLHRVLGSGLGRIRTCDLRRVRATS